MDSRRRDLTGLLPIALIVLVAFGLRIWAWDEAPPGVTHDEAAHLQDAQRIWDGARPIYLTTAYGREPFFDYATAPLVGLLGMNVTTGRLAAALWGTALVVVLYVWVLRASDRRTALLAAGMLAVSFWPLATGRQILRSGTLPVLLTAAVGMFWRATFPPSGRYQRRHFLIAGLTLGLSFYTYLPARVTWIVPVAVGASLIVSDRPRWRKTRVGLAIMILTMLLVAAPLLGYLLANPELEVRLDELAEPLQALRSGSPGALWSRVKEGVLMFSHRGDTQWIYNVAGRPLLPPVMALLFYLGIVQALVETARTRRPFWWVLLLWLALGTAPALVTGLESSSLRAIAAQPAVFVLAALPLAAAGRSLERWGSRGRIAWSGLQIAGGAMLLLASGRDYFDHWATHRETRVAYHSHLVAMVDYVDDAQLTAPLTLSTIYPSRYHDPSAAATVSDQAGTTANWRWHDARFALVFPSGEDAVALFPALAPLNPALAYLFAPYARFVERVELDADDLSPWFEFYEWKPDRARSALSLGDSLMVGGIMRYVGHDLRTPDVSPGEEVVLVTFWEPLDTPMTEDELVLFAHLLREGEVVQQQDQLDAPPFFWQAGDLFAQLHRLAVPADLPPGQYELETGAYWRVKDYPRLPVYDGDQMTGDRILLSAVNVIPAD